jgi:mono/diheme cytochrome c family protein
MKKLTGLFILITTVVAALLVTRCNNKPAVQVIAMADSTGIFSNYCSGCHGDDGKGAGVGTRNLTIKTLNIALIETTIQKGVQVPDGHMTAFPNMHADTLSVLAGYVMDHFQPHPTAPAPAAVAQADNSSVK